MALAVHDRGIHTCGYHESLTSDKANVYQPTESKCLVCAGREQYERVLAETDKRENERLKDNPRAPRAADGRTTHMRLLPPDEAEAAKQRRAVNRGDTP